MKYIVELTSDNSRKKIEKLLSALKELGVVTGDFKIIEEETPKAENQKPEIKDAISLIETVEMIYNFYPKKQGKAKGMEYLNAYLTKGRVIAGFGKVILNHHQISLATRQYAIDCKDTEKKFIQDFSTFMNKTILDYVDKTKETYEKGMEAKYGIDWREKKFTYR